jgi:hypothetical protein
VTNRYQKASEMIEDLLAARPALKAPTPEAREAAAAVSAVPRPPDAERAGIHARLRARETPAPRFCWKCRKALPSRAARCPFCGEGQ